MHRQYGMGIKPCMLLNLPYMECQSPYKTSTPSLCCSLPTLAFLFDSRGIHVPNFFGTIWIRNRRCSPAQIPIGTSDSEQQTHNPAINPANAFLKQSRGAKVLKFYISLRWQL